MPELPNPNAGEAFRALRRGLNRSRGFALFVCTCDAVVSRDDYIDRLESSMPGVSFQRIKLTEGTEDLLEIVSQRLANGAAGPLMIVGLEQVLDGAGAQGFLSALNLRRSEWPQRVPHPVVFWLPRRLLGVLTSAAPDFFDWRSDTFHFPELTVIEAMPLAQREWKYGPDPRLNVEQQAERRSELKARIASAGTSQDEVVLRHVLDWWDELADLEKVRGELDEALRIRQQEQLPVYERLGDVRERSVTLYKIALALLEKSDLEFADTETGHVQQALDALAEAFAIVRQRGFADVIGAVGLRLAQVLARDGRHAEALEVLEQSIAAFDILGNNAAADQARALRAQIEAAAA